MRKAPLPPMRNCIDTVFLSCFSGEELNTLITLLDMAVVDLTSRSEGSRPRLVGDGNEGYTLLVEDVEIVSALELREAIILLAASHCVFAQKYGDKRNLIIFIEHAVFQIRPTQYMPRRVRLALDMVRE